MGEVLPESGVSEGTNADGGWEEAEIAAGRAEIGRGGFDTSWGGDDESWGLLLLK